MHWHPNIFLYHSTIVPCYFFTAVITFKKQFLTHLASCSVSHLAWRDIDGIRNQCACVYMHRRGLEVRRNRSPITLIHFKRFYALKRPFWAVQIGWAPAFKMYTLSSMAIQTAPADDSHTSLQERALGPVCEVDT